MPFVACACGYVQTGLPISWWRHQMDTFSVLLAICVGNLPVTKAGDTELWCFLWSAPWINGEAGDLRRNRAHYDVTVMILHWHRGHHTIGPAPMKQSLRISESISHEYITNSNVITIKQSTTAPCACCILAGVVISNHNTGPKPNVLRQYHKIVTNNVNARKKTHFKKNHTYIEIGHAW